MAPSPLDRKALFRRQEFVVDHDLLPGSYIQNADYSCFLVYLLQAWRVKIVNVDGIIQL